jgi:cell division protein FtsL
MVYILVAVIIISFGIIFFLLKIIKTLKMNFNEKIEEIEEKVETEKQKLKAKERVKIGVNKGQVKGLS